MRCENFGTSWWQKGNPPWTRASLFWEHLSLDTANIWENFTANVCSASVAVIQFIKLTRVGFMTRLLYSITQGRVSFSQHAIWSGVFIHQNSWFSFGFWTPTVVCPPPSLPLHHQILPSPIFPSLPKAFTMPGTYLTGRILLQISSL